MTRSLPSPRLILLSAIATLIIGLATFTVTTVSTSGSLVWSDGLPYFLYARSAVLDLDTDITNEYDELDAQFPADAKLMVPLRSWTMRDPRTGRIVTPWPVGAGLVMVPFYASGYAVELAAAAITGQRPDSYGIIPQYFFCFGALAYGLLGFWAIFLCCREVADDTPAYLASLGIIFGGPAAFYIFFNPSMAHASSLGLISLLILLWLRQWRDGTSHSGIAFLGLLLGTAFTVRYQNALFGVLPLALMFRETSRRPFSRLLLIGSSGIAGLLIPLSIQFLHAYFWGASGDPVISQQSGVVVGQYPFDLKSPYFFHVLFSSRHGAFYWAPVLAMGMLGLVWAARRQSWAWPLLIALLVNVYLIGALGMAYSDLQPGTGQESDWNTHWRGAPSFGMRYLTECAALFAIGLAVLIDSSTRWVGKLFWPLVLSLLAVWNGLLILAYGLKTISRSYSLTYHDMLIGVSEALKQLVQRIF
ncbi:MAG: hypothetical protein ABFR65_00245 [Pseudomonadota bacterium]